VFVGMSILCGGTREERLEAAFTIMDADGSGHVSRRELEQFLVTVAPWHTSMSEIQMVGSAIMREADTNNSGLITFLEFIRWQGKDAVIAWLDNYLERITSTFSSGAPVVSTRLSSGLPWASLNTHDLLRVFASESWDGQLDVNEFGRVLQKLLGMDRSGGSALAGQLFPCFDRDGNGLLDFREVFVGMSILCGGTREERIEAAFTIMDADGSGHVSQSELMQFLVVVAPVHTSLQAIKAFTRMIMLVVDTNQSGQVSFVEFMRWQGKDTVVGWLDDYLETVSSNFV